MSSSSTKTGVTVYRHGVHSVTDGTSETQNTIQQTKTSSSTLKTVSLLRRHSAEFYTGMRSGSHHRMSRQTSSPSHPIPAKLIIIPTLSPHCLPPSWYWSSAGRSGLAVACLTAVREVPGSNRAVGSCVYRKNHCDLQPWARAVCTFPAVPRSTQPSTLRGTVNEYQLSG